MRTTLTLDDDVAAELEHLRAQRRVPLKRLVNEALRAGLRALETADAPSTVTAWTTPWPSGGRLVESLDDVEAVLDELEGPRRR